jgi:DNA repair protein RadD
MSIIIPRDYQTQAIDIGTDHMIKGKGAALEVLPTGSGKSIVIANIAKNISEPVLVFQPSKEILEQNYQKLIGYEPFIDAGIFSASMGRKQVSHITFATIGSAVNQMERFRDFKHIIIDECHLVNPNGGMYKEFLNVINANAVLGLTATPYRLASNRLGSELRFITRTRPKVFKKMIYQCDIRDLYDHGYLAQMRYRMIDGFDTAKLKQNTSGSDYKDESLKEYYEDIHFDRTILGVTERLLNAGRKSILVFTKFTQEARLLVEQLGEDAAFVSAETPSKERAQLLADFKAGKIKVVANVGVLTTGFDYPELDTILLARPTMSLALYYQMVGRGLRPHPSKESCWVVDMCENFKRFGRVENLEIVLDDSKKEELWYVRNRETLRRLTNVPLGENLFDHIHM